MRTASIAVGIENYVDPLLASSQSRLHYATDDASGFHRYASSAWSSEQCLHLCLLDNEADQNGLEQAFRTVKSSGSLDLFLLYLSGHGEVQGREGWFCLADAVTGQHSLTSADIDRLLFMINAEQVLVIADYCYAEASLAASRFFAALEGRAARKYIASARSNQQAWEDSTLKRSIFSDIFLKSIAIGSPLAERDGKIDVEAKLFPCLREQVPLEVAARKRGRVQEPVIGGLASGNIWLLTVAMRDMRRALSISDTLRMRLRRILAVGAIAIITLWIFSDLLFYHLVIGPNGAIWVRPGLAALHALSPFHLVSEVDTGFEVQDISIREQDTFLQLSQGSIHGVSTRKDRDGLAMWLGQLEAVLTPSSSARTRMITRADTPDLQSEDPPPVWEAAFVAYANASDVRTIADRVYPSLPPIELDCERPFNDQLDFSILNVPSDVFARDILWRALRIEGSRNQDEIIQLITAVAYRVAYAQKSEQVEREIEALIGAAKILKSRSWKQIPSLKLWCEGVPAVLVRSVIGNADSRASAEASLISALPSSSITNNGENYPKYEMAAIAALTSLVTLRPLQESTIKGIVNSFVKSGELLGLDTPLNRLLLETSANQPLPQNYRAKLFKLLSCNTGTDNFEAVEAFRLLARNSSHLSSIELSALKTWLSCQGESYRTDSTLHEGLGYLAQATPLKPEEIGWLVNQLSPYSFLTPQTVSYRGVNIIGASDGAVAIALARINRQQPLAQEVIERLRTIAANRHDLHKRKVMLRGLGFKNERFEQSVFEGLSAQKHSAVMRRLYIDVAVEQLHMMPLEERLCIISKLFLRWQRTRAPEIRLAFGEIIGRVMMETQ